MLGANRSYPDTELQASEDLSSGSIVGVGVHSAWQSRNARPGTQGDFTGNRLDPPVLRMRTINWLAEALALLPRPDLPPGPWAQPRRLGGDPPRRRCPVRGVGPRQRPATGQHDRCLGRTRGGGAAPALIGEGRDEAIALPGAGPTADEDAARYGPAMARLQASLFMSVRQGWNSAGTGASQSPIQAKRGSGEAVSQPARGHGLMKV